MSSKKSFSPEFYPWLAGFLYGDGSVFIHKHPRGSYFEISACQKDPEVLYFVQSIIEGCVRKPNRLGAVWRWNLIGKKAEAIAEQLPSFDTLTFGTDSFWAWLAGFIDADGYLGTRRYKNPFQTLIGFLVVEQKDPTVLKRLQQLFGGSLGCYKHPTGFSKDVGYWKWSISSKTSARVAYQLLPYLQVKQKQALQVVRDLEHLLEGDSTP